MNRKHWKSEVLARIVCTRSIMCFLLFLALMRPAEDSSGQGLLVDQQGRYGPPFYLTEGSPSISQNPEQSFVPNLSGVGFAKFAVGNSSSPNNGVSASLYVLLREGAFDGAVLSSTAPVVLPSTFTGVSTFLFPENVPVNAGETYWLELRAAGPSDAWRVQYGETAYPKGMAYADGKPWGIQYSYGLAFSEGVVIPEPATISLFVIGIMCWIGIWVRRRHMSADKG